MYGRDGTREEGQGSVAQSNVQKPFQWSDDDNDKEIFEVAVTERAT